LNRLTGGYQRLKLLLKFPAAIPYLFRGRAGASAYIDRAIATEYRRRPLSIVKRKGVWIYLRPDDFFVSSYIQVAGVYDPDSVILLERFLKRGDVVFDVGANIGWHALICAKSVGPEGQVHAFEPEPANFVLLSKSVAENSFQNVRLFEGCVGDVEGEVELKLSDQNPAHHSLVWNVGERSISVPCVRLDDYAERQQVSRIDMMVLDVEGAEPLVLRGAMRLLSEGRIARMILEYSPDVWKTRIGILETLFNHYDILENAPRGISDFRRVDLKSSPTYHANLFLERK
jgi:FkbM family methyltransferase